MATIARRIDLSNTAPPDGIAPVVRFFYGLPLEVREGGSGMLKDMKAYAHLKPGQKGTRRLTEQYGERLLCVRYRYDELRGVKLKTVELIVDEWAPGQPRFKDDELVPLNVAYDETELRALLRKMRGRWDAQRKQWFVLYGLVRGTVLEARIAARP